jgi:DnaK suppressor protein
MKAELVEECKKILLIKKEELETRLDKIQNSKIRSEPLSADWPEQAQKLENKEVVDALDDFEHDELSKVNFAVKLIEKGNYGNCITCESEISISRLKAVPWASQCIKCAK